MLNAQIPAAAPEVVALASAIADVIVSVKAKGAVLADLEAALPDLLLAGAAISNIGADVKLAHNQAFVAFAIGQALEPA
jgi:hypothetical protein